MTIVGNVYDKYGTRNPIARALMRGFLDTVGEFFLRCRPARVLEVGCGEGELARFLHKTARGSGWLPAFTITDLTLDHLAADLPPDIEARTASIDALPFADRSFDLVVCCEVLEHLGDPHAGLREVSRVAAHHVLLSTPREPIWRVLNVARGKYLRALGNTPGHVQHFSRRGLLRLATEHLHVLDHRTPLPWTVLLGAPRHG